MDRIHIDLTLARGDVHLTLTLGIGAETFAVVGPSGAGKSTLLRAVAGLERPDSGRITIGEQVVFDSARGIDVPPADRGVGMVFQDLALFPHMSVAQNVAYGGGDAGALLDRFAIGHLANERPGRLSGGERQRVALARALSCAPRVLLLDEPLAALDARTRAMMRTELADHVAAADVPVMLVTHDFDDAVALADRVGVLDGGTLRQIGTPSELVAAPADAFVASLTGVNLLTGTARAGDEGLTMVVLDDGQTIWSSDIARGRVNVAVAPWEIAVGRHGSDDSARNALSAPVRSVAHFGNRARIAIGPLVAEITGAAVAGLGLAPGDMAVATFKATATRLLPIDPP